MANLAYHARRLIAVDEIPDDASIFINIGTTTEAVARALLKRRDLMVITNNLNVANILVANPHCDVVVTGGILRRADSGLVGESTVGIVEQFRTDYAVIGAAAIGDSGALLDFDYRDVRVTEGLRSARR